MTGTGQVIHLQGGRCSVVLDARATGLPVVVYWGPALGETDPGALEALCEAATPPVPHSAPDSPGWLSLLPQHSEGYAGLPGLEGHRGEGGAWAFRFEPTELAMPEGSTLVVDAADADAGLALRSELSISEAGMLRMRHVLRNDGRTPYAVQALRCCLPLPAHASELLDLTGRWCLERQPQRHPLVQGSWRRDSRRGRTGHDATLGLLAGTPGFGFRHGQVWAAHVAWSGNHQTFAERLPDGTGMLGGGELILPGEIRLAPGEEYAAPWLCAAYSSDGIDGISAVFHDWLRARDGHPRSPRPVVLNTWEAVYFDHDLDRLRALADEAARIGVERFVLDDGWFRGRRDDTAGLGDWFVDETTWPQGLHPLVEHVTGLGMQFGLWVEPEMVNPDSDLYRAHPDWVLAASGRLPPSWRHQQVLDLANPDAFGYVLERLDALLDEYAIAFLKWDHNRDLVDAGHDGRPGVHAQTLATYRLLDELRRRHPGLEIESCASGGARVDLGILERTDRVWASDSNDALDRQAIQRWTGVFLPPELIGAHVGPPRSHTTGRVHDSSFRAATALFGHAGIEWDITGADESELADLSGWIEFYKRHRGLLHTGRLVHADHPDPAALVHGVVASDGTEALFAYVQLASGSTQVPGPLRLPGLVPGTAYRVRAVHPGGQPRAVQRAAPPWMSGEDLLLSGRMLAHAGLRVPVLAPEQALLLHLVGGPSSAM
ncbi:MAG TPA: alpha-galactosidase [Nocardioidaceae bacterium]|nr:alpha-galactosidase [Nocardioidaceae bacterium]